MLRKRLIVSILLVAVLAITGYVYLRGKKYTVVLTNEQIQEQVNSRFPITKNHLLIFSVTYQDPKVVLREGSDTVTLGLTAILNARFQISRNDQPWLDLKDIGGTSEVTAKFRYEPEEFAFYLDSANVESLRIHNVPERYLKIVEGLSLDAVTDALRDHPVYTLRATDTRKAIAKMVLKDVIVQNEKLYITLGL